MVMIFNLCFFANSKRSGVRAMVPSSLMISQMTPAGSRPARRARSTAASVWPARFRTPISRARRGKMWPGVMRSSLVAVGLIIIWMVLARSEAEIPVVVPCLVWASMETVKAVFSLSRLLFTMSLSSNFSSMVSVTGRQTNPRASLIMKLMASEVAKWAAMTKSPSFSRSSSSMTISILPFSMSLMASSIVLNLLLI